MWLAEARQETHHRCVLRLVQRICGQGALARLQRSRAIACCFLQAGQPLQQGEIGGTQPFPAGGDPLLIGIFREQVSRVVRNRRLHCRNVGSMPGPACGGLKRRHVCLDLLRRAKHEDVTLAREERPGWCTRALQGAARQEEGATQVIGGGVGIEIGPQSVLHLLAVQAVTALQGKQFQDGGRASLPPGDRGNQHPGDPCAEPAQYLDTKRDRERSVECCCHSAPLQSRCQSCLTAEYALFWRMPTVEST